MESTSPVQRVKIWFFHNGADASYFDRLGDYMNDMGLVRQEIFTSLRKLVEKGGSFAR